MYVLKCSKNIQEINLAGSISLLVYQRFPDSQENEIPFSLRKSTLHQPQFQKHHHLILLIQLQSPFHFSEPLPNWQLEDSSFTLRNIQLSNVLPWIDPLYIRFAFS